MWSDAARASSMQARGGSLGGGGSPTGGSGGVGAAGNVSGGSQGIQSRLAQAGAGSRGQWSNGKTGKQPAQRVVITGDSAAHQQGVNAIAPNMRSRGAAMPSLPPAYYPNVAKSSYGYGDAGMPGL